MKIRLNFFNKAYSAVMDIPEDTGLRFDLVLTQPLQVGKLDKGIPPFPELPTIGSFEWEGYYDGSDERDIRIYRLVDIRKR